MNQEANQKLRHEEEEEFMRMQREDHDKSRERIRMNRPKPAMPLQKIQIPIIRLEKTPTIKLESQKIDFSVPKIISDDSKIRITRVPIVRLDKLDVELRPTELDDVLSAISRLDKGRYLPIPIFMIENIEKDIYIFPP